MAMARSGHALSESAATLRCTVARDGADMQLPDPYGWLMPLVASREALAATLDATADALRKGGRESSNDDWQPLETSPCDDPTDPLKH